MYINDKIRKLENKSAALPLYVNIYIIYLSHFYCYFYYPNYLKPYFSMVHVYRTHYLL